MAIIENNRAVEPTDLCIQLKMYRLGAVGSGLAKAIGILFIR